MDIPDSRTLVVGVIATGLSFPMKLCSPQIFDLKRLKGEDPCEKIRIASPDVPGFLA